MKLGRVECMHGTQSNEREMQIDYSRKYVFTDCDVYVLLSHRYHPAFKPMLTTHGGPKSRY